MKRLMTMVFLVLAGAVVAFAQDQQIKDPQMEMATNVLNEIMSNPDKGIPRGLVDRAVCVGIVPSAVSAAFGTGAFFGRGVLVCRRHGDGPWGAAVNFSMAREGFGFEIRGKSTDFVFLVNEAGTRKFVFRGTGMSPARISLLPGPVGPTAEAATDAQLHAGVLGYTNTRGALGGLLLQRTAFLNDDRYDRRERESLYGRDITTQEILFGNVPIPPEVEPLRAALERWSPRGGSAYRVSK